MENVMIYGSSGFIGSNYCRRFPRNLKNPRDAKSLTTTGDALYLISTTNNYNVFNDS